MMAPLFDDDTSVDVTVTVETGTGVVGLGDGELGKAVAIAPWPDSAFVGKACAKKERYVSPWRI
jgi:hypothetical protein